MKRYWIAALLVLAMMAALLTGCGEKKQEEAEPDVVQPQVQEDPDMLVCSNGKTTLRFQKDGDRWVWFDDTDFPLDQSYVQELLDTLQGLSELTPITPAKELSDYGLEAAKAYIMLRNPSGDESFIYLGKTTDDGCYMFDGTEENGVYLAPASLMKQISRSIYDMAQLPNLPRLTMETMTALDVAYGEKEQHFTVKDGAWYSEGKDVTEKMTAVTEALSQLEIASCVDYRPSSDAARICGLTKDAAVLTVSYGEDRTFTLAIGWYRSGGGYYAAVNDDTTIYLLSTKLAEPLKTLAKEGL